MEKTGRSDFKSTNNGGNVYGKNQTDFFPLCSSAVVAEIRNDKAPIIVINSYNSAIFFGAFCSNGLKFVPKKSPSVLESKVQTVHEDERCAYSPPPPP